MSNHKDKKAQAQELTSFWERVLPEYEQVKAGTHPHFRFVCDLCDHYKTARNTLHKYYHLWKAGEALQQQKRGAKPKYTQSLLLTDDYYRRLSECYEAEHNRYEVVRVMAA